MLAKLCQHLLEFRVFPGLLELGVCVGVWIKRMHNAVDAALETQGEVAIGWREKEQCVEIFVQDEGPGIMNPANLFVPFFTTKPDGSGIGLPLSRQIAEAHGGSLVLLNRKNGKGAQALLSLPR